MDFNTGPESGSSGGDGQGTGGPPRGVSAGSGGEFDYRDPVQSFTDTVKRLILQPAAFFRGLTGLSDFLNPLIFALICSEIAVILGGVISLATRNQGFGGFIVALIVTPIGAAIGLFIGAGIFHLLVILIVGSGNSGYAGTFRVSAYSSATSLVSWIPIIGPIASLYGIYLAIIGIREVHSTTTGRAAIVVLIPAAVVLLLILLVVGAVVAFFISQR